MLEFLDIAKVYRGGVRGVDGVTMPAVNQVKVADYLGTVLVNGHPAGLSPRLIAGLAMAMLTITFVIRSAHHARR